MQEANQICFTPLVVYTVAGFCLFMAITGVYLFIKISSLKYFENEEEDEIGI